MTHEWTVSGGEEYERTKNMPGDEAITRVRNGKLGDGRGYFSVLKKLLLKESIQGKACRSALEYTQVYWQDIYTAATRKLYFAIRR